ncbi:MAG TPA: helix-turn-helix transcriptional regulator [Polyangiaceae bacterium]|nr:helix-turn-helix transcriptional regulator [Polyangiaceae bacterium]
MRGVRLTELQQAPVGSYVSGPCFAHGCLHPALWVLCIWGRPNADIARSLGRSLVFELAPPAVPHASFIDTSGLESGGDGAFEMLEAYLTHHADALAHWVQRVALVRPKGLSGALVSGIFQVAPRPFDVRLFDDPAAALSWLHQALAFEPAPSAALQEISAMRAAADVPEVVRRLRRVLSENLRGVSIEDAARALALSPRTLQRRLSDARTTFQDQMADARVAAAQRLLLDGSSPITRIAFDVGCASPQHLSALFKKRTGVSPSEWRRRRRKT